MQKLGIQLLPPSHFTLPSSATKQTSERPSPPSQLHSDGSPAHCSPQREREGLNSPSSVHSGPEYSTTTSSSSSRASENGSATTKSDLHRYSHVNAHANARVNVEGAPTTADGHFHDSGLPASLQDAEPCDRERRFRWKRGEDEGEWSRKKAGTSEHYTAEHVIHGMRTSRGTLATPNVHQARGRPARATLGSREGTCSETEGDAVPAGQYWDNTEEIVARSLARCQKIDKSLEFYAPLRKKWSDSSSASTSPTLQQNNSSTSSPSGTEQKKIGFAAGNNNSAAPPTIANCTAAPKKQQNPAEREVSRPLHHRSTASNSSTAPKLNGEPDKPREKQTPTYSSVAKPPTRIALNDLSSVPQGHVWSSKPRNGGCVGQQQRPPTLTLVCPPREQVVVPAQETGSGNALRVPTPIDTSSWANERVTSRQKVHSLTHINCPPLPGLSESERDELCPSLNPPQFDQEREEDEEDINDFDSVQQDSDTESIEPLTGAFAEAVLTGSYTPLSPLSTIASTEQLGVDTRPVLSTQSSSDSDGVVREKTPPVSTTRNDTLLARVLQAEEESRAGVSLTPNTINDLAIARQIQEDLDQQSLTEDPSPSGAEGRGPAIGDRSSNNFDTVELEEPHFYGKGYTTGGEHAVTDNQWNQGATVQYMTRDPPPQREERDMTFEARERLEEVESGIDSQIIERMSHQYVYMEEHRRRDPSVTPATQCAVCLDEFHVGDTLRLMPCSHTFHRDCVDKWLEDNSNCPVCKTDMCMLASKMGLIILPLRKQPW